MLLSTQMSLFLLLWLLIKAMKNYQVTLEGQKSQNTYLVTGNLKHFPSKPFVVSPKQMIDIMLKDEADELFRNINRDIDLNNRSR